MFRELLKDECGNIHSTEYILMIVLLAIGGVVGLATLRDQVAQELVDVGVAMDQLDQSYSYAVPGMGYDPNVPPPTGYIVSSYNDTGAGNISELDATNFPAAAVGSEKVVGVSSGDSN